MVHKASVDDRDQSVAFDVLREWQIPVRLLDVPFLLKLGGSFSVICDETVRDAGGHGMAHGEPVVTYFLQVNT
jgi:hypothetical protein